MNIERMMWANDYPHSDSTWPWSQDILKEQLAHMTEDEKNLVLHDNVAHLYRLDTSKLQTPAGVQEMPVFGRDEMARFFSS